MTSDENLIEYYVDLLILQYKLPKAQAHVRALVKTHMLYELIEDLRNAFNIFDSASEQLDVVGKYTGVSRTVTGFDFLRAYFGYISYEDEEPFEFVGYDSYEDEEATDAQYFSYFDDLINVFDLTDEEYRFIQELSIVRNNTNGSIRDVDELLTLLFEDDYELEDNFDMSFNLIFNDTSVVRRLVTIANAEGLIPKPSGVNVIIAFADFN